MLPGSSLPLAYFAFAHAGLITACLVLVVYPGLPGAFFLHPRMVAVVHLVTLAWLSGSILGAFYIVAPLALGMPFAVSWRDWIGWAAFLTGATGMATHFWIGEYHGMAWSAGLVVGAIGWVGWRAAQGLPAAPVPPAVKLHVALAFANVVVGATIGIVIGLGGAGLLLGASPLSAVFAHAHVAAVGWVLMLVVGLGYRLLPMILPAKPPTGAGLAASAFLIETGLAIVVVSLLVADDWVGVGALAIGAGLASFARRVRGMLAHRLPRPPALPSRDWAAWQVHGALAWIVVALGLGLVLSVTPFGAIHVRIAWVYGVAGLVGGLSQIVVGMQGRLVPFYAYYRAMAARRGAPPERSAHSLVSAPFARAVFLLWTIGVPALAWGLAASDVVVIRVGSAILAAGVATGGAYLWRMLAVARAPMRS